MDTDNLPPALIVEILSRLGDSSDLARCRVASKTLNSLSRDVRSINLHCSLDRYTKSRSGPAAASITPFKLIFTSLVSSLRVVESVSIGVEKPLDEISFQDIDDEGDDFYLTDTHFVQQWLPLVCKRLRAVSVSDFWVQSCWRRSSVLALISSYCNHLLDLEIKNAWLSVDGLLLMPKLTTLTLEFIRLDDENLEKVNECFPYLHVLNLIGVGGFKEPRIHLEHLKHCHWTVSNAPCSVTIVAPRLVRLNLSCVKPNMLVIDAPSLSDLHLSLQKASSFTIRELHCLDTLHLVSMDIDNLIRSFQYGRTVERLVLGATNQMEIALQINFCFDFLFAVFPNVKSITLAPQVWLELERNSPAGDLEMNSPARDLEMSTPPKELKEITAYLSMHNVDMTMEFIFYILKNCFNLRDVALFIPRDLCSNVANDFIAKCTAQCSRVRLRLGTWKEGTKDAWISDGM